MADGQRHPKLFDQHFPHETRLPEQPFHELCIDLIKNIHSDTSVTMCFTPDLEAARANALSMLLIPNPANTGSVRYGCTIAYDSYTLPDGQDVERRMIWAASSYSEFHDNNNDQLPQNTVVIWPTIVPETSSVIQPEASQVPVIIVFDSVRGLFFFKTSRIEAEDGTKVSFPVLKISKSDQIMAIMSEVSDFVTKCTPNEYIDTFPKIEDGINEHFEGIEIYREPGVTESLSQLIQASQTAISNRLGVLAARVGSSGRK